MLSLVFFSVFLVVGIGLVFMILGLILVEV